MLSGLETRQACENQPFSSRMLLGCGGCRGELAHASLQPPGRIQRSALLEVTPAQRCIRDSVAVHPAPVGSQEVFLLKVPLGGTTQSQLRFGQLLPLPTLWLSGLGEPTRRSPSTVSTKSPLSGPSGGHGRGGREGVRIGGGQFVSASVF